jgi:hypothetical protein
MANDKKSDEEAHRARNRTVMLTPDITGEVRSRLSREAAAAAGGIPSATSSRGAIPMAPTDEGFVAPSSVAQPTRPAAPSVAAPVAAPSSPKVQGHSDQPLIGFLVSFDSGPQAEYFELRVGRRVVTSDAQAPGQNLVIDHPTVSPMHAILRVAPNGTVQVLDQLSEHGTLISRAGSTEVETLSGEKSSLNHGDRIQFGERLFTVCLISKVDE